MHGVGGFRYRKGQEAGGGMKLTIQFQGVEMDEEYRDVRGIQLTEGGRFLVWQSENHVRRCLADRIRGVEVSFPLERE